MIKTSIAKLIKFENMRDLQDKINLEILETSMKDLKNTTKEFDSIANSYITQIIVNGDEAIIIFTYEQERRTR